MNPKDPRAIDERPFEGMKIDDHSILEGVNERSACSGCHKSRKYFCYTCYLPVPELQGRVPVVRIPLQIDILKHRSEIDGKSTAAHAAILAPDHVKIYTYPDIPNYENEDGVYLIYPSAKATRIGTLITNNFDLNKVSTEGSVGSRNGTLMTERIPEDPINGPPLQKLPIKKVVFIDSTWNQSRGIYKDERVRRLPCVVLQNRASQFWRHQKGSPRWYLATIEAVHQFLLEVHGNMWGVSPAYEGPYCENYFRTKSNIAAGAKLYCGEYDNLLFFFSFMYKKIHSFYAHDDLQSYKRPI